MNQLVNSLTTLLAAIIGVAILSVILSKNSDTSNVITAGAKGFGSILGAAEAPITGGSTAVSGLSIGNYTGYPMG